MKYLLTLTCFLLFVKGFSQVKTNFSITSSSGYENNIFKSPKTFLDNGVIKNKDELYRNSLFQEGGIRFFAKKKWRNQSLSFRFNPKGIYYYSEKKSSYFTFFSGFRYINELTRKTTWQINSWYRIKNRDGINIDGSELNFPLGNNHLGFTTSLDFRLYKPNRSSVKLIYGNRAYKESNNKKLTYNAIGINTVIRNVFKRKAGWHSYGIEGSFITKFFNQKDLTVNATNTFNWRDMSAEIFYRYPITKELDVKPLFEYKKRIDSNKDKFSYNQLRPSLNIVYKNKKTEVNLISSYINREYITLEATDNNWTSLGKLKYQYYQLKLEGEHKLNKKLSLNLISFINTRKSNKTNENSIFFREYEYYNVSLGLKYRF